MAKLHSSYSDDVHLNWTFLHVCRLLIYGFPYLKHNRNNSPHSLLWLAAILLEEVWMVGVLIRQIHLHEIFIDLFSST